MKQGKIVQAILIPNWISRTIFDLSCVFSAHKESDGRICYLLYDWDSHGNYVEARPGQWLCEYDDGRWLVLSDKEYKEKTCKRN